MEDFKNIPTKNFVTAMLQQLAPDIGAYVETEPEYENVGIIHFENGARAFFRGSRFNVNPSGSVEISIDKNYTSYFLNKFGYNTAIGKTFYSQDLNSRLNAKRNLSAGLRYAQSIGFPVVVKPNNFSGGKLVTKVYNESEFLNAAKKILKETDLFLVERFYEGNDFRVVTYGDEVIAAYQRKPLIVVGNGTDPLRKLLEEQKQLLKDNNGKILNLKDRRITAKLKRLKLKLESVISENQIIRVLDNANLTTGGSLIDLTHQIHPEFADLSIRVAKAMGLRFCGIDIIAENLCTPVSDYTIIEVNSAPGLIYYAHMNAANFGRVKGLYMRILKDLEKSKFL